MALSTRHYSKTFKLLAGAAVFAGIAAGPAAADFPGERWSVGYVKVEGDVPTDTINAVNLGLTRANETYFYGDRATRMDARIRGNLLDVRIVDPATGQVIAKQTGLPIDPANDTADTVTTAALQWMDGLGCVDGCNLAESGAAAQPVQVAAAPAAEAPAAEAPAATDAEAPATAQAPEVTEVAEAAETPASPEAPAPAQEIAAVEVTDTPVTATGAEASTIGELTEAVQAITAPSAPLVADAAEAPAAATQPESAPGGLDADTVLAEEAARAAQRAAEPTVAAAPSTGSAEQSPGAEASGGGTPSVAAVTAGAAPAIDSDAPSAEGTGSAPAAASDGNAPQVAAAPATPAADTETEVAASSSEQPVQEVSPGVTLPQAGSTEVTPLLGSSEQAPVADTGAGSTPEVASTESGQPAVPAQPQPAATAEAPAAETQAEEQVAAAPAEQSEAPAVPESDDNSLDGEVLAIANPATQPVVQPSAEAPIAEAPATQGETANPQIVQPQTQTEGAGQASGEDTTVETQVAAVDPDAAGPTLANARWVGFTPAVFSGADGRPGAWISGPFDRKERQGWITDTATGATTRVTFIWREGGQGSRTATLSREAARALGLGQGDVANVAVYLPR